jgi:hypothetical protein
MLEAVRLLDMAKHFLKCFRIDIECQMRFLHGSQEPIQTVVPHQDNGYIQSQQQKTKSIVDSHQSIVGCNAFY